MATKKNTTATKNNKSVTATAATEKVRISVMIPSALKDYITDNFDNISDGVATLIRDGIAATVLAKRSEEKQPKAKTEATPKTNKTPKAKTDAPKRASEQDERALIVGEYSEKSWYIANTSKDDKKTNKVFKEYKGKYLSNKVAILGDKPAYYVPKSKVTLEALIKRLEKLGNAVVKGKSVAEAQAKRAAEAQANRESKPKADKVSTKTEAVKVQMTPVLPTESYVGKLHGCNKAGAHKTKENVTFNVVPNEDGLYYYTLGNQTRIAIYVGDNDWLDVAAADTTSKKSVENGGKLKGVALLRYLAVNFHDAALKEGKLKEVPAWVIQAYASIDDDDCKAIAKNLKQHAA